MKRIQGSGRVAWSGGIAVLGIALGAGWIGCALIVGIEELKPLGASSGTTAGTVGTGGGSASGSGVGPASGSSGGPSSGSGGGACQAVCDQTVWGHPFGNQMAQIGKSVAVDKSGNVVVTGEFVGSVDFGHGPKVSQGNSDIFVTKFDTQGKSIWDNTYGYMGAYQSGNAVAVDPMNNIWVVGTFNGSINLGKGPVSSVGMSDIFVVKFDPSGNPLWSNTFSGDATGTRIASGIAVDNVNGRIVITGKFNGSVDFDGAGGEAPWSSVKYNDIFLAQFDFTGKYMWGKSFGGQGDDSANGVAVDKNGEIWITGSFTESFSFGATGTLPYIANTDVFVAKLDNLSGVPLWATGIGDAGYQEGRGIAVSSSGEVVVVGSNDGNIPVGGTVGVVASTGGTDVFIIKFASNGVPVWGRSWGGMGEQIGHSVAVDANGNVLITGFFGGNANFGGGLLDAGTGLNIFVAKYNPSGNHLWSNGFGDGVHFSEGTSIAVSGSCSTVVTGRLQGSANFGCGLVSTNGNNNDDIFIAKLTP